MATSIFRKNFPQVERLESKLHQARYVIGLDLHKKTSAITVIDTTKQNKLVLQRKRIEDKKLFSILDVLEEGHKVIVAEASYGWSPLRIALEERTDVTLAIFDTRKTSAWIASSGIKNDKIDAEVLAYACLNGGIPRLAVYQSSMGAKENFKLVNLRDKLASQKAGIKNQLKALERDYGINPFTLKQIEKSDTVHAMENSLLEQLAFVNKQIQNIEKEMKKIGKKDEIVAILDSIPGVGPITSFALRWKMETIERFKSAKHLASYFGFGIRERQSGDHLQKGKITKAGNNLIRKLLVQGAQVISRTHPEYLKLYFPNLASPERMKDKKHVNKVVVALARKQLVFAYYCWKNKTKFSIMEYKKRRNDSVNLPEDSSTDSSKSS